MDVEFRQRSAQSNLIIQYLYSSRLAVNLCISSCKVLTVSGPESVKAACNLRAEIAIENFYARLGEAVVLTDEGFKSQHVTTMSARLAKLSMSSMLPFS